MSFGTILAEGTSLDDTSELKIITPAESIYSQFVRDGEKFAHALRASMIVDICIDEIVIHIKNRINSYPEILTDLRNTLLQPFQTNFELFSKIMDLFDVYSVSLSFDLEIMSEKSKAAFVDNLRTIFSVVEIRQVGEDKLESTSIIREFRDERRRGFVAFLTSNGYSNLLIDKEALDKRAGSARLMGKENFWARGEDEIKKIAERFRTLYFSETPDGGRYSYESIVEILNDEFGSGRKEITTESLKTYIKKHPELFPRTTMQERMAFRSGKKIGATDAQSEQ